MEKGQKEQNSVPTEVSLAKMEHIHAGHKRRRKELGRQMKKAEARLEGAKREVLKRRFLFDISQLEEQLNIVAGKEAWAERMVRSMTVKLATNKEGDLVHRPLAGLKNFKL